MVESPQKQSKKKEMEFLNETFSNVVNHRKIALLVESVITKVDKLFTNRSIPIVVATGLKPHPYVYDITHYLYPVAWTVNHFVHAMKLQKRVVLFGHKQRISRELNAAVDLKVMCVAKLFIGDNHISSFASFVFNYKNNFDGDLSRKS